MFLIAQLLSFITLIIQCSAMQFKDKNKIILFIGIGNIFSELSYIFLKAYTGFALGLVATIRMFTFYFMGRKENFNKKLSFLIFLIFEILLVVSMVITYEGFLSFISLSGYLIYTYGCWQKNKKVLCFASFYMSFTIIIYNIFYKGYVNLLLESVFIVSTIIALVKEFKNSKSKKILYANNSVIQLNENIQDNTIQNEIEPEVESLNTENFENLEQSKKDNDNENNDIIS